MIECARTSVRSGLHSALTVDHIGSYVRGFDLCVRGP